MIHGASFTPSSASMFKAASEVQLARSVPAFPEVSRAVENGMTNAFGFVETFRGGFSSSALAMRQLLSFNQAYGIYLTSKRLVVTKEKPSSQMVWRPDGGSLFGTVTSEIKPFFDESPRTVEELDHSDKKVDVDLNDLAQVELKRPSYLFKGHVKLEMKLGKTVKVLVMNSTNEFSEKCFEAARELFRTHLPEKVKEV